MVPVRRGRFVSLCDLPHPCCVPFSATVGGGGGLKLPRRSSHASRRRFGASPTTAQRVLGPPLPRIETMPTSTQTHHPQGWAPTSPGTRDAQLGGNGRQRRQGDRPEGGGVDEALVI